MRFPAWLWGWVVAGMVAAVDTGVVVDTGAAAEVNMVVGMVAAMDTGMAVEANMVEGNPGATVVVVVDIVDMVDTAVVEVIE